MDLATIIEEIAARADDFLAGATNRTQSRAGIEELLTMDYGFLSREERSAVTKGVMQILEDEDFFGMEFVGDPFSETNDDE
jgi:hypothetical protein